MRDIYVKTHGSWKAGTPAVRTEPMEPGYHTATGFYVTRILDVPEAVSDALAVFTFNSCYVAGHTVQWTKLHKGEAVRGEGYAWAPVGQPSDNSYSQCRSVVTPIMEKS